MQDLKPFFAERHFIENKPAGFYEPLQWGANIQCATQDSSFDWEEADIVILGCGEWRGEQQNASYSNGPDVIREQFYQMYDWHPQIKIADLGNIRQGVSADDTRAALRMVLHELQAAGKIVYLLGGSHDLTLQQYDAFKMNDQQITASVADMLIDLDESEEITSRSFLMDMLTTQPNYVRHYSHIGFQSYNVHPRMLETLDKLRFDFYRLGRVRENIDVVEPALRSSHLFSFDINAVRFGDAPVNRFGSPNGFTGEEACVLTRFAGMSHVLTSFGIYGYDPLRDIHQMTAKLLAQMLWYFIDGVLVRRTEASIEDRGEFVEFHVSFTSNDTTFLKSKRTGRWWMQLPNHRFVPCAYTDYLTACNDEIPERWLREQERMV